MPILSVQRYIIKALRPRPITPIAANTMNSAHRLPIVRLLKTHEILSK